MPAIAALAGLLLATPGAAQNATSVATPMDLTKPQFDTETRQYDTANMSEKAAKSVVAEVDGRTVSLGDVGDAIRDMPGALSHDSFETLYPTVLHKLVERQALVIRAQHKGLDVDPSVRRRMKAASDQALMVALLDRETAAAITEKDLLDAYDDIIGGKPGEDQVHARLILVGTETEASAIIAELKDGADFASVARRASKDPTAPGGGDLGFVRREDLNAEVGAVVFALAPGEVDPYPVRSSGAWFVVKAEERRHGPRPSYIEARTALLRYLQRNGVAAVVKAALQDTVIREYSLADAKAVDDRR